MTHDEKIAFLRGRDEETVAPWVVSKVLGGDPYWYVVAAKAGMLELPHMWRGRNLRIYKQPLIRLIEKGLIWNEEENHENGQLQDQAAANGHERTGSAVPAGRAV
jgi:hypothetical protein